jgi:hypothetical protein
MSCWFLISWLTPASGWLPKNPALSLAMFRASPPSIQFCQEGPANLGVPRDQNPLARVSHDDGWNFASQERFCLSENCPPAIAPESTAKLLRAGLSATMLPNSGACSMNSSILQVALLSAGSLLWASSTITASEAPPVGEALPVKSVSLHQEATGPSSSSDTETHTHTVAQELVSIVETRTPIGVSGDEDLSTLVCSIIGDVPLASIYEDLGDDPRAHFSTAEGYDVLSIERYGILVTSELRIFRDWPDGECTAMFFNKYL